MEPLSPAAYYNDVKEFLESAIAAAEALADTHPTRPLSLVLTKLEEAEMWLDRVPTMFVTKGAA